MQLKRIITAPSMALMPLMVTLATAQPRLTEVSFKLGAIRNVQRDHVFGNDTYAIYPELQIGGPLIVSEELNWGAHVGYWDDGVNRAFPFFHGITNSYNSVIVGARFGFMPAAKRKDLIKLGVFVGFSHHLIWADYVGGYDFSGRPGRDFYRALNSADFGLLTTFVLGPSFKALLELQTSTWLEKNEIGFPDRRWALKFGVTHLF
jgi:hypothetical protein